eukprot:13963619-Alexandrium_andersonii.AAC.1
MAPSGSPKPNCRGPTFSRTRPAKSRTTAASPKQRRTLLSTMGRRPPDALGTAMISPRARAARTAAGASPSASRATSSAAAPRAPGSTRRTVQCSDRLCVSPCAARFGARRMDRRILSTSCSR